MDATGSMTAEELLHLNLPNKRTELVRGRLIVREPAGYRHGDVAARLLVIVGVLAKVADWLKAGTRLVWVVDPVREHARVYRADGTEALVAMGESLEGEDVVPGFSCVFDDVLS